ncbi:uncharacterized protein TERG_12296 [Trichophyton rubrum CBS 118892]|uniref:Uncharacterized protein n=1 Tax=Trichophyton rubrum (strain ATCC MYA-4607 / CBS 118892) TaxID=559305 RepID=A0A080WK50_TRIRC|nr:uncharacterized protein TERG_12296 [Trichophyton rubrum CBS 118892]KFL61979.1 hypothetical protein TERG_12296 [Trichophyton rubrum CBS 118892]
MHSYPMVTFTWFAESSQRRVKRAPQEDQEVLHVDQNIPFLAGLISSERDVQLVLPPAWLLSEQHDINTLASHSRPSVSLNDGIPELPIEWYPTCSDPIKWQFERLHNLFNFQITVEASCMNSGDWMRRDSRHVKAKDRPNSAIMCLFSFGTAILEQGLNGAVLVFALWLDPQLVVKK